MSNDTLRQATVEALRAQMDDIHQENTLYWAEKTHSRDAEMQHQMRQERLEQIRNELDEMQQN